jgi:hypothetical protein
LVAGDFLRLAYGRLLRLSKKSAIMNKGTELSSSLEQRLSHFFESCKLKASRIRFIFFIMTRTPIFFFFNQVVIWRMRIVIAFTFISVIDICFLSDSPAECMGVIKDTKEAVASVKEAAQSAKQASDSVSNTVGIVKESARSGSAAIGKSFRPVVSPIISPTGSLPSYNVSFAPSINIDTTTASVFGGGAILAKIMPAKYKAGSIIVAMGAGCFAAYTYQNNKHKERLVELQTWAEVESKRPVQIIEIPVSLENDGPQISSPAENYSLLEFINEALKQLPVSLPDPQNVTEYIVQTIWLADLGVIAAMLAIGFYVFLLVLNNQYTFEFIEKKIIPSFLIPWFKRFSSIRLASIAIARFVILVCVLVFLYNTHCLCANVLEVLKLYFSIPPKT